MGYGGGSEESGGEWSTADSWGGETSIEHDDGTGHSGKTGH